MGRVVELGSLGDHADPVNESKASVSKSPMGSTSSDRANRQGCLLEHFVDPRLPHLLAIRSPTPRRTPTGVDRCEQLLTPNDDLALRAPSGYLIGAIGLPEHCRQVRIAQSSVTGWRSLMRARSYAPRHPHIQRLCISTLRIHRLLLRLSSFNLLRTAHSRRRVFSVKGAQTSPLSRHLPRCNYLWTHF